MHKRLNQNRGQLPISNHPHPAHAPKMRNEPNSRLPGVQPPTPHPQKRKTNPISATADLWRTKKCETNPICPHGHLDSAKRTQLQHTQRPACIEFVESAAPLFLRNQPNPSTSGLPSPPLRETNPIYHATPGRATQNAKTNPIKTTPAAGGPPLYLTLTEVGDRRRSKNTKRTQSTTPTAKNAKRTQFTPPYTIHNIQSLGPIRPGYFMNRVS